MADSPTMDNVIESARVLQRVLKSKQRDLADDLIRRAFAETIVANGVEMKSAEDEKDIFKSLKHNLRDVDWDQFFSELRSRVQDRVRDLEACMHTAQWSMPGGQKSWHFVDGYFKFSWIGENYLPKLKNAPLDRDTTRKPKLDDESLRGKPVRVTPKAPDVKDPIQRSILEQVSSRPQSVDDLVGTTGMDVQDIMSALTMLEMQKRVVKRKSLFYPA